MTRVLVASALAFVTAVWVSAHVGADLFEADLEADLVKAELVEADLAEADLAEADLVEADLQVRLDRSANAQPDAVSALSKAYCQTCHNDRLKTGGLSLEGLTLDGAPLASNDAETWEKVIRKVRSGLMPPAGAKRPERAALDAFAGSIENAVDRAAAAHPNPGRAPLHRMNRVEYENAIRDLLALDVDSSTLLPADDSSRGFDNIADVLGVSPSLLERYVSAAAKISRLAVGERDAAPAQVTYTVKGDLSQNRTLEGMPLGTRGGTTVTHNFPVDGEYVIRLALLKLSFGQVFGEGAEGEEIEVTLNGQRVKLFKLDEVPMFFMRESPGSHPARPQPTDPLEERVKMTPDIRLEFKLKVKAGPQAIGVAFLNKAHTINEDLVRRPVSSTYDVFIGMQYGYTTAPHLSRVVITGPYNASGLGDTPSRRRVFVCRPSAQSDEAVCAKQIISSLVRRAYRRAPTEADVEPLLAFFQDERNKTGNFEAGLEIALRRILADPEFIFRFEPPPASVTANTAYRISDTELASRLSFFLWSSIPDEELLKLAIDGKLRQPAVLERQTRRMLADPKARALVTNFANQWLFLRELKNANPDVTVFPDFDDNLRQAFQRETEMLFESVMREDRSVLDLLDSEYTFVNERLAKHYGIPNIYGPDFRRVPVPSDARRGLLGHGSLQLVTSNPNRTSPVMRGKWILENLLGTAAPTPPPDVPPLEEKPTATAKSVRERIEQHRASPACAGCHKIMDPIGLAMENFDAVGRWRTIDEGVAIDASAQLVDGTAIDGPASLRKALLDRQDVFLAAMTEKLMMYGVGRETKYHDMPAVRTVMRDAAKNRYRFSDLILGVVKSAPFQMKVKS
jgi:mono/diheme cytochrome c family protein